MSQNVLESLVSRVNELAATQKTLGEQIQALSKPQSKGVPGGAPHARSGENPLSSRGYSFLRFLGFCAGQIPAEQAKVEIDVHNRLQKQLVQKGLYNKAADNAMSMPFSLAHLGLDEEGTLLTEVRNLLDAGVAGCDPEEVQHYRRAFGRVKAMSSFDTSSGAALIAPPVQGEMIDILRNNTALFAAGARDIGMSANGRMIFPRQTGTCTPYWVGEGASTGGITESQPSLGNLIFEAKKMGVVVRIPNELFRFASPSADAFIREDIAKQMAILLDATGIDSPGSTVKPKGLLHYTGITTHVAATVGTNGNTLTVEDVGDMIAKVEEANAEFKSWIMRPLMYSKLANRRADAVSAGDAKGPFLFNMHRGIDMGMNRGRGNGVLEGYLAVKSTNVPNNRVKGSGTNLTCVIGGDFSDMLFAMGGMIEFFTANQGGTEVVNDQTLIRGTQYCDIGLRREASFVVCDTLLVA